MKIKYTPAAIADLQEIKNYISKVLHNPKAAGRIVKRIMDHCGNLKELPKLGMSLSAKTGQETDLRYLICDQYLAIYRVEEDMILIARILDGRTDYMRVLFKSE